MIKLNGRDVPWQEGMTIRSLIQLHRFTFPALAASINGVGVDETEYEKTVINDKDEVLLIHLIAGG